MEAINKDNYEAWLLDYAEGALTYEERLAVETFLAKHPELHEELDAFEPVALPDQEDTALPDWSGLHQPDVEDLRNDQGLRDAFFVKCMDGEATPAERQMLENLLVEPAFQQEFDQWKKTVLGTSHDEMPAKDLLYQWGLDLPLSASNFEHYLIALCEGLLDEGQKAALTQFAEKDPERKRAWALAQRLRLRAPLGVFYPDKAALRKEEKRVFPLWFLRAAVVALVFGVGISLWYVGDTDTKAPIAKNEPTKTAEPAATDSSEVAPAPAAPEDAGEAGKASEPPLEEWEVLEPDPAYVAESTQASANGTDAARENEPEKDIDRPMTANLERISKRGASELSTRAMDDPSLATTHPWMDSGDALAEREQDQPAESGTDRSAPVFASIPQLATKSLAKQLDLDDHGRDELALALARRLTEKAGEALNTEVSKQIHPEGDHLTYTLRIGGLKVSHSRSR